MKLWAGKILILYMLLLMSACGGGGSSNSEPVETTSAYISISSSTLAPSYTSVTLSGIASERNPDCYVDIIIVVCFPSTTIHWSNSDANVSGVGYITTFSYGCFVYCGTIDWQATIPLVEGDNHISISISDGGGTFGTITKIINHPGNHQPTIITVGADTVNPDGAMIKALIENGGSNITAWVDWGIDAQLVDYISSGTQLLSSVGHNSSYSYALTGANDSTTYYYRFAIEAGGYIKYSAIKQFTTTAYPAGSNHPLAVTGLAEPVGAIQAVLQGELTSYGIVSEVWFEWGTDPELNTAVSTPLVSVTAATQTSSFSYNLDGLQPATEYYYRLHISNVNGTDQGTIRHFSTQSHTLPSVTTVLADQISDISARINGKVTTGGTDTQAWFEWGTDPALSSYTETEHLLLGFAAGDQFVNHVVEGLTGYSDYYYRLVAVNDVGLVRGQIVAMKTDVPVPSGLQGRSGDGQLSVSWDAIVNAESYNIYIASERNISRGNYSTLADGHVINSMTPDLVINGLENEKRYYLVVTGIVDGNESGESLQLSITAGVSGGWQWINPGVTGNDLVEIEFADTLNGWIVGDSTILYTSDGGISWNNRWKGAAVYFTNLSVVDGNTVWASDHAGMLVLSSDAGLSWQARALPAEINQLYAMDFISVSTGWLSTNSGVYKTDDMGKTWQKIFVTTDARQIKFTDSNNGWFVATPQSDMFQVYSTVNGGQSWTSQSMGRYLVYYSVAMDFTDIQHGWMVDYESGSRLYSTNNGGASWNQQSIPTGYLRAIAFADDSIGWVAGDLGRIYYTDDSGMNWIPQDSGVTHHINAMQAIDILNVWAVGSAGTILHSIDGGATWQQQNINLAPGASGLTDVEFVDSSNGWALGYWNILHTSDGGMTWSEQVVSLSNNLHDFDMIDASNGWAVGNGSQIFHTVDGGANWNSVTSPVAAHFTAVSFVDSLHGWISGSGYLLATSDGGNSWNVYSGTSPFRIDFVDSTTGFGGGGNVVVKTVDGGISWQEEFRLENAIAGQQIWDIYALDSNTAWAVDNKGNLLGNINDGMGWRVMATFNTGLYHVFFIDAQHGWVSGGDGAIYATEDGGNHWIKQNTGTTYHPVTSIYFTDMQTGWAVGGYGVSMILHTDTGGAMP